MSEMVSAPYLVSASVFLAWWKRLGELDEQFVASLTSEEWQINPAARNVRHLRVALQDVGMANGAIRFFAEGEGHMVNTFGKEFNPNFDWDHGTINLTPEKDSHRDGPRGVRLAELLVEVTGIAEQEQDPL